MFIEKVLYKRRSGVHIEKNNKTVRGFIGFGVAVIVVGILIDGSIATIEKEVGAFTRTEFS